MDAAAFVKDKAGQFDVIIVDSSDPVGPAETLYTSEFYADMKAALRPGGIICTQGECIWLHLDLIAKVMKDAGELFNIVDYAKTSIPTYPSGTIGFIMCSVADAGKQLKIPSHHPDQEMQTSLRYYNKEVHSAAFVLPQFAEAKLGPHRKA